MTIMITDSETGNGSIVLTKVNANRTADNLIANHGEQRELLEALARIQGFSLVDRVERKSLLGLVEEIEESRGPGGTTDVAYAGVALAAAVSEALRIDDPKEV